MNQDNGYVAPDAYQTNNTSCHKSAMPGNMVIPVAAGDKINLQWNTWPDTHKGPVQDYLAACTNGNCTTVDSAGLKFFKIDAAGMHNDTARQATGPRMT
jgi:lytic cellulose monooxygenase (C1-hydroxylating)